MAFFPALSVPCLIPWDVLIGPIQRLLVGVQFLLERHLAEIFLNQAFVLAGVLPFGEACTLDLGVLLIASKADGSDAMVPTRFPNVKYDLFTGGQ